MLNFKSVSIVFLLFLLVLFIIDQAIGVNILFYVVLVIVHLIFLTWGSFSIGSQFYIETQCSFSTNNKEIVLTFDDGPDPLVTPEVLDVLKNYNVRATFFCIGRKITMDGDILKRMRAEGHDIGLHSFRHSYLYDFYPATVVAADIKKNRDAVEAYTGLRPLAFRPPYGVTNPAIARVVRSEGYRVVGWTIRSLDTVTKNEDKVFDRILDKIQPGSILLLHDHLKSTPHLLERILEKLMAMEYKVVSLPSVIEQSFYDE